MAPVVSKWKAMPATTTRLMNRNWGEFYTNYSPEEVKEGDALDVKKDDEEDEPEDNEQEDCEEPEEESTLPIQELEKAHSASKEKRYRISKTDISWVGPVVGKMADGKALYKEVVLRGEVVALGSSVMVEDSIYYVEYLFEDYKICSWAMMLKGCDSKKFAHGRPRDALCLLNEMEIQGLKPNSVTILSMLSACSHGGLIEDGLSIFLKFIKSQEVKPSLEHYACLVDLLSCGGKLDLAMELVKEQNVGPSAWGALLSGCRMSYNGNEKIRGKVVDYVLELEPNKSTGYMLASSMYAAQGLWYDAARIRVLLKDKQVKVVAGYSMVQVNNKCCRFIAGNKNQLLSNELRATIQELHDYMKIEKHTC